jgi:hypothetical protein
MIGQTSLQLWQLDYMTCRALEDQWRLLTSSLVSRRQAAPVTALATANSIVAFSMGIRPLYVSSIHWGNDVTKPMKLRLESSSGYPHPEPNSLGRS